VKWRVRSARNLLIAVRGPAGGSLGPDWEQLSAEIRSCTRCPLHQHRFQVVIYRGGPNPHVIFVGEAPGATEDRLGLPFVGASGRRLDTAIDRLRLGPTDFGVLNLLKCRPPGNRFVQEAAQACRPYLDRQLALLQPRLIVTLGAHALRAFDPTAPAISMAAGQMRSCNGWKLFPLVHPAAGLHSRRMKERWERDVATLAALLPQRSNQTL
jgi:uracil-DNA glycosylase